MAPVRSYYNWNQRKSDTNEAIEPYRKYFFICEGANTETWYFEKLLKPRRTYKACYCRAVYGWICGTGLCAALPRQNDRLCLH